MFLANIQTVMAFVIAMKINTAHEVTNSSRSHSKTQVVFKAKFKVIIKHTTSSNTAGFEYSLKPSLFFLKIEKITKIYVS